MGPLAKFATGVVFTVAVVGTIVMVKLISEAGKTLRQELKDFNEPDA